MNVRKPFDPSPDILVHGVEVNREQTAFVAACEDGFRVYNTKDCRLKCFREFSGSLQFANILSRTNVLALLGGKQSEPKECPRGEVVLWDNAQNELGVAVSDGASRPLRVLLSNDCFIPICENGVAVFRLGTNFNELNPDSLLQSYSTTSNPHAVGVLGNRYFAFPGISKGKLQLLDLVHMKSSIINAHASSLRAITLSADEELLATTSDRGTIVRIWSARDQSKVAEFRRGLDEAAIFNLAFSPDSSLLALTSDKGTLHIFELSQSEPTEARISGENQRHQSDTVSGTSKATNFSRHPTLSSNKKTSSDAMRTPSSKRLSFPPVPQENMSASTILTSSDPTDQDPGMPSWQHVSQATQAQKKSARFQDQPPASILSGDAYSDYASSAIATGSNASGTSMGANKAKKYGSLAKLPFGPSLLRDEYSVCNTEFTLPGRAIDPATLDESTLLMPPPSIPPPTVVSSSAPATHRRIPTAPQGKNLTHGIARLASIAQGAPPKGQIAWTSEYELIVVSAGRGGRWEKFKIEHGSQEATTWRIQCVGWKAYLDEEGD